MAAYGKRVSLALLLTAAAVAVSILSAVPAFAQSGDMDHMTDLAPYLGSSLTTALVNGGVAPTGSYYFKMELFPGQTFRADFTPGAGTVKLEALKWAYAAGDTYVGSTALPNGSARLTFTATAHAMYTICAAASSMGTFTVSPSIPLQTIRLFGPDRIATAIAVSQRSYPASAAAAVIAYGYNFPDALAAAPLAKAYGGPILLTQTASLRDDVIAELERIHPETVYVIGAANVVGPGVEDRLKGLPGSPNVTRLGGKTRYETAALIADELRKKTGNPSRVVVVNGDGYADAMSAGPLAGANGWPILLTQQGSLPSSTRDAISRSGATASLVVGSTRVVSDAVKNSLPNAFRANGEDRYQTCARVADFASGEGCSYDNLGLATGINYPDALAAGPYLAQSKGLLLLASPAGLSTDIVQRLSLHKANGSWLNVIGSGSVVPAPTVMQAQYALQ